MTSTSGGEDRWSLANVMPNGGIGMSFDSGPDDEVPPLPSGAMDQGALLADPRLFCRTCVEILKISGVGLTLLDGLHLYGQLGASDDIAIGLEWTEFTLGEGPRSTAARTGAAVLEADITAAEERYPLFARAARHLGANAIFIFPVGSSLSVIATLSLYNCASGDLSLAQLVAASMLAAAAAPMILSAMSADTTGGAAPDELSCVGRDRESVHLATGFVAEQLHVSMADALAALRARAWATNQPLLKLSAAVIERRLRLD
ncbi:MAG: hypothetical protein ACYCST_04980 [Acidimicrobiales bacterium]